VYKRIIRNLMFEILFALGTRKTILFKENWLRIKEVSREPPEALT